MLNYIFHERVYVFIYFYYLLDDIDDDDDDDGDDDNGDDNADGNADDDENDDEDDDNDDDEAWFENNFLFKWMKVMCTVFDNKEDIVIYVCKLKS